jgi:hypothetical protein
MADHIGSCLACQAELAGYRRLLRVLRSLRDEPVLFPSPDLIGETLAALSERLARRPGRLTGSGRWGPGRPDRDRDRSDRWLVACALVTIGVAAVGARALAGRSGLARPSRLRLGRRSPVAAGVL